MKKQFSRRSFVFTIALVVLVGALIYAFADTSEDVRTAKEYDGFVLMQEVEMDEKTRTVLERRLSIVEQGIKAHEQQGEEVPVQMYETAAANANLLGDLVKAREYYEIVLNRNPIHQSAWNSYGTILYYMQDFEGAESAFRQAVQVGASEENYRDLVNTIDRSSDGGRVQEIIGILEEGVGHVGQTEWFMVELGRRHTKAGNCDEALAHYNVAKVLDPNNENLLEEISEARAACQK